MTSTYDSCGRRVGATVVQIDPNFVTQVKTVDLKDGYNAIQLGVGTKKSVKKPQIGHTKKVGLDQKVRWFREVRIKDTKQTIEDMKPGTEVKLNQVFSIGDAVKVQGISKGKGFQGGMKRHGFHGGPKTHGQSDRQRAPGAIGSGTTPGRVYKGKKMAGHMGDVSASVKNLEVVGIDKQKNLLVVKGAIPGASGSLVTITKLGKIKGYTPLPEEKNPVDSSSKPEEEGEGESVKGKEAEANTSGDSAKSTDESPVETKVGEAEQIGKGEENASS